MRILLSASLRYISEGRRGGSCWSLCGGQSSRLYLPMGRTSADNPHVRSVVADLQMVSIPPDAVVGGLSNHALRLTSTDPFHYEDVSLIEFMYLVGLFTCVQVRLTVGDSGLCCCVCVASFKW